MRSVRLGAAGTLLVLVVTACSAVDNGSGHSPPGLPGSSSGPSSSPSSDTAGGSRPSDAPDSSPNTSPGHPPAPDAASRILAQMSLPERVGQLFMVNASASALDLSAVTAVTRYHVGSLYLGGQTSLSVQQTAAITAALQQHRGSGPPLFISADQEGGQVQRFTGPGFSAIPTALVQGTVAPGSLRAQATQWGSELAAAGVNLDLAPVLDTVPSAAAAGRNPPIGGFEREFGYDPATVATHGVAVMQGLAAARVATSVKHFPGLGRVAANTDTSSGVVDSVTTRHDPYLAPFAAAAKAGTPFVMMSTAVYARIDPDNPAAFSPAVVQGMLRGVTARRRSGTPARPLRSGCSPRGCAGFVRPSLPSPTGVPPGSRRRARGRRSGHRAGARHRRWRACCRPRRRRGSGSGSAGQAPR